MKLIFATNNQGKLREIQQMASPKMVIQTLWEAGITEELPEPFQTFKENALSKANYVREKTGIDCFSEDSGLVVPALGGQPGVFSARYAGIPSNDERNNQKLIEELRDKTDLKAWYLATICLLFKSGIFYFEGECKGRITLTPSGHNGFGYDPLFIPEGYELTFGRLAPEIKASISHRSVAFRKLAEFFKQL